MRGAGRAFVLAAGLLLAGCGAARGAAPTPTPTSVLADEYLKAANAADKAEDALSARLASDCQTLDPCKQDFAAFDRIEASFNTQIRAIRVPPSMDADLRALLDVERRRLSLIDDAARASSLDQINQDFRSLAALENRFGDAVDHIRLDLGLPAAPQPTPVASPSLSPSASA